MWNQVMMFLSLGLALNGQAQTIKPKSSETATVLYRNDFEKAELDKLPDDMMVIDGAFAVKQTANNKYLELPGAPLDTYGVLFGPTEKSRVVVTARIRSASKGRRLPTFGVGLNGSGGFRLVVSPGKKALEIFQGDEPKTTAPFEWKSGAWTLLKLRVRPLQPGAWKVEGKAWTEGTPEPPDWLVTLEMDKEPNPGRATVWGCPFSGIPIQFDDLQVVTLNTPQ